jgi:Ca2+-binding RTX toxin-like protein
MPNYDSLATQITEVKAEISSSLAASNYAAQDLVFVAKALETLGTMLGVNDIVAATAANVTTINSTGTTNVNLVNTARTAAVSDIESRIAFNPMLLIGV